jgi:cobalamin synthase
MEKILDKLRMAEWLLIALVLVAVLAYTAPAQIPIIAYKALLVTFFAFLGYWIDRRLFGHSRCGDTSIWWLDAVYQMRRAIIVSAVVLAGALAL